MAGKEDGLDVLMREIQSNTGGATGAIGAKTAAMATAATAVPSTDDWDWSEEDKDSAYSQKEEQYNTLRDRQIAAELKHFIHDMVDCNVRDAINAELQKVSFRRFLQYYQQNDQLALYTINTELHRMKFGVTHLARTFTLNDAIRDVFEDTTQNDLWRMSNQSIFADMLVVLQRRYLRADLSVGIASTESRFDVNLDEGTLRASSHLTVSVPTAGGTQRLLIASFMGNVSVDTHACTIVQRIESPKMSIVFDEQILEAARAIRIYTEPTGSTAALNIAVPMPDLNHARQQLLSVFMKGATGVVGGIGKIVGADTDDPIVLYRREPKRSEEVDQPHRTRSANVNVCRGTEDTPMHAPVRGASDSVLTNGKSSSSFPVEGSSSRGGGLFGTWIRVAETFLSVAETVARAAQEAVQAGDANEDPVEYEVEDPPHNSQTTQIADEASGNATERHEQSQPHFVPEPHEVVEQNTRQIHEAPETQKTDEAANATESNTFAEQEPIDEDDAW